MLSSSRTPFVALVLAATACSAQPQQSNATAPTAAGTPEAKPSRAPVTTLPDDAPAATVRNIPATTGRANRTATKPPFAQQTLATFDEPFAIAFLPDGAALVTEKAGKIKLRRPDGTIAEISGAPKVLNDNQGGLLDIAPAPDFAASKLVYISYSEPRPGGSSLALARGLFTGTALVNLQVLWRAGSDGVGGQFGAILDRQLARIRALGHHLQREVALAAEQLHAHQIEAECCGFGGDQRGQVGRFGQWKSSSR